MQNLGAQSARINVNHQLSTAGIHVEICGFHVERYQRNHEHSQPRKDMLSMCWKRRCLVCNANFDKQSSWTWLIGKEKQPGIMIINQWDTIPRPLAWGAWTTVLFSSSLDAHIQCKFGPYMSRCFSTLRGSISAALLGLQETLSGFSILDHHSFTCSTVPTTFSVVFWYPLLDSGWDHHPHFQPLTGLKHTLKRDNACNVCWENQSTI